MKFTPKVAQIINYKIEELASVNGISYMDAIVAVSEEYDIEIEELANNLNRNIKESLELEAANLNLIDSKINSLDV